MLKSKFIPFALPLLLLLSNSSHNSVAGSKQMSPESQTGTLQKMIVADASVTMNIDLNRLDGITSPGQTLATLRFVAKPNSFFTILVFNDLLRGAEAGSMELIPQNTAELPASLNASLSQLAVEKMDWNARFDFAVRDSKTGFVFFNVEGNEYDYDANAQLLSVTGGRLLISEEFANALGRPSGADLEAGRISIGAAMQPVEVQTIVNGETKSMVMPPLRAAAGGEAPTLVPGPDVIVGELPSMEKASTPNGGVEGNYVGLGVGTTSCNNGDQPLNWFAIPNTDHPVIPQNLYRMSGGVSNNDRFEQIGQSWLKHAFTALQGNACGFGCTGGCGGSQLCPGCSDPYSASLNYSQSGLGSRAWVHPFTGAFPSNARDHTGHTHLGASHRVRVAMSDLDPPQNPGATYFAEAQYVTPHEYAWCQSHPGECNMYNNVSYRRFSVVNPPPNVTFSPVGGTVRTQPAIMAWTGATITQIEPAPGTDGVGFVAYKVTQIGENLWHYEYAVYNQNLDRAIQSFAIPNGCGIGFFNIGFHAPPQEPGWANDGTQGNMGYSSAPWLPTITSGAVTWSTETFAQNQNANAIRWGTMYNFRFDSYRPPQNEFAVISFFKTGAPIAVPIQGPAPDQCFGSRPPGSRPPPPP